MPLVIVSCSQRGDLLLGEHPKIHKTEDECCIICLNRYVHVRLAMESMVPTRIPWMYEEHVGKLTTNWCSWLSSTLNWPGERHEKTCSSLTLWEFQGTPPRKEGLIRGYIMVVDNPLIPGLEYGWKNDDVSGRSGIPNKKAVDVRVLWIVFWKVSGLWLPTQHDWEPGKTPEGSCVKCTPPEFWRIDTQNNLKENDICHSIFGIYSWNFGGVPALWFPGEMANGKAFLILYPPWN